LNAGFVWWIYVCSALSRRSSCRCAVLAMQIRCFFLLRYMVALAKQERVRPSSPHLFLYPPQSFLPSHTTTPTPSFVFLLLPPSPFPSTFHNPPQVQHKSCNTQLKNETRLGLTRGGGGLGVWTRKGEERGGKGGVDGERGERYAERGLCDGREG